MKFHDETKPQYIGTDVYEAGQGTALLHTRSGTSFPIDEAPDREEPVKCRKKDTAT